MCRLGGEEAGEAARRFFSDPSPEAHEVYERLCLPVYTRTTPADGGSFRSRAIAKPEVGQHFFRNEMMTMDLRPELSAIACPTLVLAGALDPVTPPVCGEEIGEAIGDRAQLIVFEGCGHGVHRDDPEGADRAIRAFLDRG